MVGNPKTELNLDQGFVPKPYAIQKWVFGPDGQMQAVYVDARTGKQISNPKGYQVQQQSTQTEELPHSSSQGRRPTNTEIVSGRSDSKDESPVAQAVEEENNYGYVDRPTALGFDSMLPGPIGLVS